MTATVAGSSYYQGGCTITGVLITTPGDTLTIVCGGPYYGGQGSSNGGDGGTTGGEFSAILKSTAAVNTNGQPTANFPECIYVMAAGSGGSSIFNDSAYGGFTQGGGGRSPAGPITGGGTPGSQFQW